MKIKKIMILLILSLLLSIIYVEAAEDSISLYVNEKRVYLNNDIVIRDGRTLAPAVQVARLLGVEDISHGKAFQAIFFKTEKDQLFLAVDLKFYQLNTQIFELDSPPTVIDGQTYVPIRVIAESFGYDVGWNDETRAVVISKEGFEVEKDFLYEPVKHSEDDLFWLSKIVTVEGADLSYEGKLAIANVVINRMKSSLFPNTVHDVIFQVDIHTQFPPAHKKGFKNTEPDKVAVQAATDALNGKNNVEDCLYFNNRPFKSKADDFYKMIDTEYFYR